MNAPKKTRKTKRPQNRSPDQGTISVSLPLELLHRIDYAAALDNRRRSNWICQKLDQLLENMGITAEMMAAAEQTPKLALAALRQKSSLKVLPNDESGGPNGSKP